MPDDCIIDWKTSLSVPYDSGLALITYAYTANLFGCNLGCVEGIATTSECALPNLHRIVFYPAIVRKMLREFLLSHGKFIALRVEYQGATAGSTLIDSENAIVHIGNFLNRFG